jgi:xanthine dehydrogenase YagR molybdenum-binding subunit
MSPDLYFLASTPPETPKVEGELPPWGEVQVVGKRRPRVDAFERVSGKAVYPRDFSLPNMLHAAILRSPYAHAKVKSIDLGLAKKMPGVVAVLGPDSKGADMEWFARQNGKGGLLLDPHCRAEGDEVAAVAAETLPQALDAIRVIKVEWEVLPFVLDPEKALDEKAPKVWDEGNRIAEPNVYKRGDLEKGFADADVVLEETYRTPCEIHVPMEVHGSVVSWDGPRLTVWDSTQGVYAVQGTVAQRLGLPLANVRVVGHYMGGGFGSKLEAGKYTVIAALLARAAGRPVKLFLSREETFLAGGNRPPNTIRIKAGVKKDGTLTAIDYRSSGTPGAYPGGTGTAFQAAELWTCPNVRTEDVGIYTNAGRARAFRAPGFPQASWALEQMMDALARGIGMDPVAFRLKNVPAVSQRRDNQPYTSTGLARCLAEGAKAFGWGTKSKGPADAVVRRGVGMAGAIWSYGGGPPSTAIVKLFSDGSVNLNMGAADIGTGTKTVMAMVVSEELGVPVEKIRIEHADTGSTQFATPSGGSKTVPSDSPAVRAAAADCKRQLLKMAAAELKLPATDLKLVGSEVVSASDPAKKVAIAKIPAFQRQQLVVGIGYRAPNPEGKVVNPFSAHFAEVEVNTRTGEVTLVRFLAAQDSGRVLNRLTFDNQVFGGVVFGIGFARTEERVLDRPTGKMLNANWHDYKVPTMLDVPVDQTVVAVDAGETSNATNTKGVGEPATIPTASAIANAVFDAIGVRVTEGPITPRRVLDLLKLQAAKKARG